jgi:hypothetical protein
MEILNVTIKSLFFDAIIHGIKKEEYREIKIYWQSRLQNPDGSFRKYDAIALVNGYSPKARRATFQIKTICIGKGKSRYGGNPDTDYYVIKLGKEISRKYC